MAPFELITSQNDIRSAQRAFERLLDSAMPRCPGTFVIGYQGGNVETRSLRSNKDIWYHRQIVTEGVKYPRYWNAFGLAADLRSTGSNKITVEINSPIVGAAPAVAGLFAREVSSGRLALLHSGKVGGGKAGVGQSAFVGWFDGSPVQVSNAERRGKTREAFLIALLDDPKGIRGVSKFVSAVAAFKARDSTIDLRRMTLQELRKRALAADRLPKKVARTSFVFKRDPYVAGHAKRRADGRCDLCSKPAPFVFDGEPFLECHHVVPLSDGGTDTIDNTVALCPNCHRRMHLGPAETDLERLRRRALGKG